MANKQIIERVEVIPLRVPYPRPMQWATVREDAASYGLLKITTKDGLIGVAEGTVKTTWTGTTLKSLVVAVEELFAPALKGLDIEDENALAKVWRIREHSLAKAMIDVAIWDIRSQVAGQPLYALWGGKRDVPVSWVVTRQPPKEMAREAEDICSNYGIKALKVKGGQGVETDMEAFDAIRGAVGDSVVIYIDPNREYSAEQTPSYVNQLADRGIVMCEDPCMFAPNRAFSELQAKCRIPFLVEADCRDFETMKLFVENGAKAFNLKMQKARGFTENWQIARYADEHGCSVNMGLFGESSLGSMAALHFSAALPPSSQKLPSETSLFLMLGEEFVKEPLKVRNGITTLPDQPGMVNAVDWARVEHFQVH